MFCGIIILHPTPPLKSHYSRRFMASTPCYRPIDKRTWQQEHFNEEGITRLVALLYTY